MKNIKKTQHFITCEVNLVEESLCMGRQFYFKDLYLKSSCANFPEALKVIYDIRWPYVLACQGESQCTPVVPAKLLIVPLSLSEQAQFEWQIA